MEQITKPDLTGSKVRFVEYDIDADSDCNEHLLTIGHDYIVEEHTSYGSLLRYDVLSIRIPNSLDLVPDDFVLLYVGQVEIVKLAGNPIEELPEAVSVANVEDIDDADEGTRVYCRTNESEYRRCHGLWVPYMRPAD